MVNITTGSFGYLVSFFNCNHETLQVVIRFSVGNFTFSRPLSEWYSRYTSSKITLHTFSQQTTRVRKILCHFQFISTHGVANTLRTTKDSPCTGRTLHLPLHKCPHLTLTLVSSWFNGPLSVYRIGIDKLGCGVLTRLWEKRKDT